ncbi:MAG: 16S rRNA (adenine(1518)-N(6)/adenine(1519)-N(6))-dimethyltransferase RsmA [Oscillospiraceae bacterium]
MENLSNIETIKDICKRYGFEFTKSLGQNFLINPNVCPELVQMGNIDENTGVIEIGTGFGVLTAELCKSAKKVVAIEIDTKLIRVLKETLAPYDNVKVINADVLKLDLAELIKEEFEGMEVCVCANLPYYITSPIIMSLLEERLPIKSITVMVQKEAAIRLCAQMGTRACGAVTAAVRYYSEPQILFEVSRDSFMPSPNVDSSVIRLDVRDQTPQNLASEEHFFKLVKASFSQRRKTLANPVSAAFCVKKSDLLELMEKVSLKRTARAEELSFEEFIALSNEMFENGIK